VCHEASDGLDHSLPRKDQIFQPCRHLESIHLERKSESRPLLFNHSLRRLQERPDSLEASVCFASGCPCAASLIYFLNPLLLLVAHVLFSFLNTRSVAQVSVVRLNMLLLSGAHVVFTPLIRFCFPVPMSYSVC
jgi:hypothetical protein